MICCFVHVFMMLLFSLVDFSFFTFMNFLKNNNKKLAFEPILVKAGMYIVLV